jgi:CheY-like chemotaxis protein
MAAGTALTTQSVLLQDNNRNGDQVVGAALHVLPELDPSTVDVLVVEDNEVNQKVLGRLLRRFGFKAHLANHGGEAIAKLQKSRHWNHQAAASEGIEPVVLGEDEEIINVSIVLMDLEMPIMDGMTCARRIRELESQGVIMARLPIIAVTAYVRPEQIGEARASGMVSIRSYLAFVEAM